VSKHRADPLALLAGLVLLVLGLVDLADTAGLIHAGGWLLVPGLLGAGGAGITWSLAANRQDGGDAGPDPAGGAPPP
jgi:hypothetical protein